jgi:hypothetical protein
MMRSSETGTRCWQRNIRIRGNLGRSGHKEIGLLMV